MAGCVGPRSEVREKPHTGHSALSFFFRFRSELLQPFETESCFDLTSAQLAHAPFSIKYSILHPPCLPNPEPFRTL